MSVFAHPAQALQRRAHPSSSLQMAPRSFSIPNQIPSGRVSLPSHLPASSVVCTIHQPRARQGWPQPETLQGVKGDSGTRSAEISAASALIFPLGGDLGWSGLDWTASRKGEMSSLLRSLDPKEWLGSAVPPVLLPASMARAPFPGVCAQDRAWYLISGRGCLHPSFLP